MPIAVAFLLGSTSFLAGVLAANLGWTFAAVAGGGMICALIGFRRTRWIAFVFVFTLMAGYFYYFLYLGILADHETFETNIPASFSGIVIDNPRLSEKSQSFTVALTAPRAGNIEVRAALFPMVRYGDLLELTGVIKSDDRLPGGHVTVFPKIGIRAPHQGYWIFEKLFAIKEKIEKIFVESLPAESAALLSGITLGTRSGFSKELTAQMAGSGTTHIVALSGYNILILITAVSAFGRRFLERRTTLYVAALIILFFVCMVGGEASVVRAAIMGFLLLFARGSGRRYDIANAMALAALLMAFIDPRVLIDIGFQLSFASLLGIVYLKPFLDDVFRLHSVAQEIKEIVTTTGAAQLAVLPLGLYYFHQFSITALFANVLIVSVLPWTMFFGGILAAISFLSPFLGFFVAKFVNLFATYEIGVIRFFSLGAMPFFNIPPATIAAYYSALVAVVYIRYTTAHEEH